MRSTRLKKSSFRELTPTVMPRLVPRSVHPARRPLRALTNPCTHFDRVHRCSVSSTRRTQAGDCDKGQKLAANDAQLVFVQWMSKSATPRTSAKTNLSREHRVDEWPEMDMARAAGPE